MANIASLDSLKKDDSKPGEDVNETYAGGNTAQGGSGLSVLGPPSGDPVMDIFARAASDSQSAPAPGAEGGGRGSGGPSRKVTMYRNGFTVDGGPFRPLEDPANQPFLADLARGRVPRELEPQVEAGQARPNEPVNVNLVDHRGEDYQAPPPPAYVAFSGEGQTMGESKVAEEAVATAAGEVEVPVVDEGQPTTTIMVRLAAGGRLPLKLNLTHSVAHIQALLKEKGAADAPYILMAGFPPRPVTDFSQTVEAAGLKGAQITQKLA